MNNQRIQQARDLRVLALTYAEIGLVMGVTRQRVHQLLRYQGHCAEPFHAMPVKFHPCKICGQHIKGSKLRFHRECRPLYHSTFSCERCGCSFQRLNSVVRVLAHTGSKPRFCSRACRDNLTTQVPCSRCSVLFFPKGAQWRQLRRGCLYAYCPEHRHSVGQPRRTDQPVHLAEGAIR